MPARVHAVLVARPGRSSRAQILHTLDALSRQTRRPDAVTLVVCGNASAARESPAVAAGVEGIIEARSSTSFAEAVVLAYPRILPGTAVWLLAHDTAPHPQALEQLAGALERSPSAALAAPKLVDSDAPEEIVSLGVTMTALGRSVDLVGGEFDQGQHDGVDEALGADIRGILIRGELRDRLRPDPALAGADEGLDLGVRARLASGRVVITPSARVAVHPEGPAALPESPAKRAYATRLAQLHRRLAYAPAPAVPLHWLTFLPLALWRSIAHLIGKRPSAVLPEWLAALVAMFRFGAVAGSRRRIREFRTASWASIAPLRVTRGQLRRRLDDGHGSEGGAVSELRFFSGGGAWAVLAALLVSVASFTSLLAWPAIGGGALLPLRETVAGLWQDAAWGMRGLGLDVVGPADPFAGVVAVLGTLWPGAPSYALVLLWLLALPLAVLGGWFAATRFTDRSALRIVFAVIWALAPTFLSALVEGRPAAVLLHLLLPWLLHTGAVAHRSWGAAGAASVVLAAVIACAPVLAPAAALLWVLGLGVVLAHGRVHGGVRLLWTLIPTAVLFAPLVLWQLQHGRLIALLADPGAIRATAQAGADAAGRMLLATGFPTPDIGGWDAVLGAEHAAWAPLLLAPVTLLALCAAMTPRWRAGIGVLIVTLAGLATAFAAVGIEVAFDQGTPVAIWPGSGLSLAWLGLTAAAVLTLDTAVPMPRLRGVVALVATAGIVVCAVPALTAVHTERASIANGPSGTLPAYVAAAADGDPTVSTLVLTPQNDGGLAVQVVHGTSETLGAQTTVLTTATEPLGTDLSSLAVDLVSTRAFDAVAALEEASIDFVLLASVRDAEAAAARELRVRAAAALDQRAGFAKAGDTGLGVLWRLEAEPSAPPAMTAGELGLSRLVVLVQLIALLAAILLAVPTRASRRAARAKTRIVGRSRHEGREPARPVDHGAALDTTAPVAEAGPVAEAEPVDPADAAAAEAADAAEPVDAADTGSDPEATEPEPEPEAEFSEPEVSEPATESEPVQEPEAEPEAEPEPEVSAQATESEPVQEPEAEPDAHESAPSHDEEGRA